MNDFTLPRTWAVGETVTKAMLDQQIRDNELWLQLGAEHAGRVGSNVGEDCFSLPGVAGASPFLDGGVSSTLVGAGAAAAMTTQGAGNFGQILLSTGTTATGGVGFLGQADQMQLGGSEVRGASCLNVPVLSVVGDRFTIRCGLGDSATAESVDFVGFRYVDNVNAGKWQGVCRSNSVESVLDTGVLAANGAYHTFSFKVAANGTLVTFYIDGASVGTIATNIPTGTARLLTFLPAFILKSLGLNTKSVALDFYNYQMVTAR